MAYSKTTWQNNVTDIDANNLNKIEQGIYDNSLVVDAVTNTLNPTDTETYKTAELTEGQITDVIGVSDILIKGQTEQDGTPTPSAPVDVNVVSGSNVIKLSSKNLLDGVSWTKDYALNENNTAFSANGWEYSDYVDVTNANYYYSSTTGVAPKTILYNNNKQVIKVLDVNSNTIYNISQYNAKYIRVSTATVGKSTTKVYEHQGKELPLDLGSIELCKIGNYQDYFYKSGSKWYLHKEIEKVVLDGSEEWTLRSGSKFNVDIPSADGDFIPTGLSNQYKFIANWDTHVATNYSFTVRNGMWGVNKCRISLINTDYENVTQFKANLATNNLIVYYQKISQLGGATNTEITDTTLISQLEAIYNAPLYEQTNITQTNNDLPMVLDITACKDNINGIKAFIRK